MSSQNKWLQTFLVIELSFHQVHFKAFHQDLFFRLSLNRDSRGLSDVEEFFGWSVRIQCTSVSLCSTLTHKSQLWNIMMLTSINNSGGKKISFSGLHCSVLVLKNHGFKAYSHFRPSPCSGFGDLITNWWRVEKLCIVSRTERKVSE